jgi:hypothetical protein
VGFGGATITRRSLRPGRQRHAAAIETHGLAHGQAAAPEAIPALIRR